MKRLLLIFLSTGVLFSTLYAEGKKCKTKGPHIWGCVKEVKLSLNDEEFIIKRSGATKITPLYESTNRGRVQPISLSEGIETIGEIELIQYLKEAQNDDSIILVDTRKPGWHARLTLPASINMPYTDFDDLENTESNLEDLDVSKNEDGTYNFSKAKTIIVFCNGYWCGQTPSMVLYSKYALRKIGYPANKIKYYRGGMQAWTSLGLTVVGDEAK